MAFKVIILRSAEIDMENAVDWYEERKLFLGPLFYDEFLICIDKLAETPQHYGYAHKNFHQTVLPSFPYKIIYLITGNEVVVHAVFHVKRNPRELINRLK